MTGTLSQFVKKELFIVLVVDLPPSVLNAFVGAINPREISKKETELEINNVIERYVNIKSIFFLKQTSVMHKILYFCRFSKHRRYISEIFDEVVDFLTDAKTPIVALYSISDSCYRVII